MKQRTLELQKLYLEGQRVLKEQGIEEYPIDAWYLMEYVTGITKASYYADPDRELTKEQAERYRRCIERRRCRIPLQHITGEQEFMGYSFHVNEHVLIPRQDTEVLVEEALKKTAPGMKILDMCTGSGCILLSLLKIQRKQYGIDSVEGVGVDISEKALKTAEENAKRLSVDAVFLQSDLFKNVDGVYDVIVSNPPYIETEVIRGLQEEVRLHDPYIALDGKEDGLHFYRRIIEESILHMKQGGWLLFEIGCGQAEVVVGLLRAAGYDQISVKKDLSGLDRVVSAMYYGR